MKRWKIIGFAVGAFFLVIGSMIGIVVLQLQNNMQTIRAIEVHEINVSNVEDGTYQGMYYYEDEIGATLEVTIENHQIVAIEIIEHIAGKGLAAEVILEDILSSQSLLVDDIAGVTTSSHILKLAIQDAIGEETQ